MTAHLVFVDRPTRWAWAEIDLTALSHNVRVLRDRTAPADLWAVVKADGYGHGAVAVARTALDHGAAGLCVALVTEGVQLREAGITAPILLLSEPPPEQFETALRARLLPSVYSPDGLRALAAAARRVGTDAEFHLKIDTGMQRVGVRVDDLDALLDLVAEIGEPLRLTGVSSHLATADEPELATTAEQNAIFTAAVRRCESHRIAAGRRLLVHLGNSAAALAHPATHHHMVRSGISLYGVAPGPAIADRTGDLRPVLSLHARVSYVKPVRAGSSISYGHTHRFAHDTRVATIPIGYADGVRRQLSAVGGSVLIGGRRRRIVGVVTMDQLMVDIGDDDIAVGDPVVLIGRQHAEEITAAEIAERLATIPYEVLCSISSRIERVIRA